ncbi:hypothetical protein [Streptomyces sp. NPDC057579]|uniref:hypothetical protein n=1 Tax=Streptomyces sp. NPDC057579 TaxID=3346172 RepID=UPI0036B48A56
MPAGNPDEEAAAQAANDARLQPGHSLHATVTTRHPQHTRGHLDAVVRHQLIPALTNKPKRVPISIPPPQPEAEPAPAPAPRSKKTTTTTTKTRRKPPARKTTTTKETKK